MKNLKKQNKGFTLIEILVVIGIIAILAAIVIIAINPARQFAQANNTTRTANLNAILNAVGQYMADNKGALPAIPNGEVTKALCNDLVPDYLPSMVTDPASNSKGASISCSSITANDVGYEVENSSGRVKVCSPNSLSGNDLAKAGSTETEICVER